MKLDNVTCYHYLYEEECLPERVIDALSGEVEPAGWIQGRVFRQGNLSIDLFLLSPAYRHRAPPAERIVAIFAPGLGSGRYLSAIRCCASAAIQSPGRAQFHRLMRHSSAPPKYRRLRQFISGAGVQYSDRVLRRQVGLVVFRCTALPNTLRRHPPTLPFGPLERNHEPGAAPLGAEGRHRVPEVRVPVCRVSLHATSSPAYLTGPRSRPRFARASAATRGPAPRRSFSSDANQQVRNRLACASNIPGFPCTAWRSSTSPHHAIWPGDCLRSKAVVSHVSIFISVKTVFLQHITASRAPVPALTCVLTGTPASWQI